MGADRSTVRDLISQFLVRANKPHDELTDDTPLYGDGLGLDSLETAELSATLEDAFGTDPFSTDGDLPETIGDVLGFYEVPTTA